MTKRYKMMAYILSSGLWDAWGVIRLEQMLGQRHEELERDLKRWQDAYDDQFKLYPYDFNWNEFNRQGIDLASRIGAMLMPGDRIYYEPSDDREFFKHDDCDVTLYCNGIPREQSLRERKLEVLSESVVGVDCRV
jgi:hypothetical protein